MEPTLISIIPKSVTGREELVVLRKREFERILGKLRKKKCVVPRFNYLRGKTKKILW